MSQRRIVMLVAAIAMGAIASFLVWSYVGGIQQDADQSAEQVPVYLVRTQIARGTSGQAASDSGAIVADAVPRRFLPANAVTDLEGISKRVTIGPLVPNQVIVQEMFVEAAAGVESFAERLTKVDDVDQVAITVAIDKTRGVAGLLKPGDFVNIMSVIDPPDPLPRENRIPQEARMMLEKAEILAIGQKPAPGPGDTPAEVAATPAAGATTTTAPPEESADDGLITFLVPVTAAQHIASMAPASIYLTLVAKDYEPIVVPPLDPAAPLPGEIPGQLTPYGPAGQRDLG